ncbi:hypothetical protein [Flexithrix dorotheae]|uniref:hypothetical protein n=1 Tax=Flexithrix dorotheae TaxID=70993 RepID=UPI000380DB30|nr:hypothetical protein [Flexithrix dorotheae]
MKSPKNIIDIFLKMWRKDKEYIEILDQVKSLGDEKLQVEKAEKLMARHIKRLSVKNEINRGDKWVVGEIAKLNVSNRQIEFFEFATLYCNSINPKEYPIMNLTSVKLIRQFYKQWHGISLTYEVLVDYNVFAELMNELRTFLNLETLDYFNFNRFLGNYDLPVRIFIRNLPVNRKHHMPALLFDYLYSPEILANNN